MSQVAPCVGSAARPRGLRGGRRGRLCRRWSSTELGAAVSRRAGACMSDRWREAAAYLGPSTSLPTPCLSNVVPSVWVRTIYATQTFYSSPASCCMAPASGGPGRATLCERRDDGRLAGAGQVKRQVLCTRNIQRMFLVHERQCWRQPLSRTAAVHGGSQQVVAGAKVPNFNHRRFPRSSPCCSEVHEKMRAQYL